MKSILKLSLLVFIGCLVLEGSCVLKIAKKRLNLVSKLKTRATALEKSFLTQKMQTLSLSEARASEEAAEEAEATTDGDGASGLIPKNLPDHNTDLQTERPEFKEVFKNHLMNAREINDIFSIADRNGDGALNKQEWDGFFELFVNPYQTVCDVDKDYLLNDTEMAACIQEARWFPFITAENATASGTALVDIMNKGNRLVNFAGYIMIRRSAMGWRNCGAHEFCDATLFKCSLEMATGGIKLMPGESGNIFASALKIANNMDNAGQLSFPDFVRTVQAFHTFLNFDQPNSDGFITKKEFKRGINNGLIMSKFSDFMADQIFNALDGKNPEASINFTAFLMLTYWYDKFLKVSGGTLNVGPKTFCQLIADKSIQPEILIHVDSAEGVIPDKYYLEALSRYASKNKKFTEEEYLTLLELRKKSKHLLRNTFYTRKVATNEEAAAEEGGEESPALALCSGLTDGDDLTVENGKPTIAPNGPNRSKLFSILDINADNQVAYMDFIKFLKNGLAFNYYDSDRDHRIAQLDMRNRYEGKIADIPLSRVDTELTEKYIGYEIYQKIDILQYLAFVFHQTVFNQYTLQTGSTLVSEPELKAVFIRLGMKIFPHDLELAFSGETGNHMNAYDYRLAFKAAMKTTADANMLMKADIAAGGGPGTEEEGEEAPTEEA